MATGNNSTYNKGSQSNTRSKTTASRSTSTARSPQKARSSQSSRQASASRTGGRKTKAQLAQEQAELAGRKADFEEGKKSLLNNGDKNFVNAKEKMYDHFPLTVHQMDIIIGVLFALIALFLVLGVTHTSFFGLFGG